MKSLSLWQSLELTTRPVHPVTARVLAERWAALPLGVRTKQQILGRHAVGCEGTHGVFPRCDLTCSPCCHSKDANKVGSTAPTPSPGSRPRCLCSRRSVVPVRTPS